MLTREQKLILAIRVNENKETIFAKYGPGVTKKKKEEAWDSIRQELVLMGATLPDIRSVRDIEWYNLRRSCIKKFLDFKSAGLPKENLPEIAGIVIDAVGMEEVAKMEAANSSASVQSDTSYQSPPSEASFSQPNHFGASNGFPSEYDAQMFAPPPELMNTLADTAKLQKKLLQLDIDLRRHQIRESKARTAYYQAATMLLNDKRSKASSTAKQNTDFNSDPIVVDPSVLHQ